MSWFNSCARNCAIANHKLSQPSWYIKAVVFVNENKLPIPTKITSHKLWLINKGTLKIDLSKSFLKMPFSSENLTGFSTAVRSDINYSILHFELHIITRDYLPLILHIVVHFSVHFLKHFVHEQSFYHNRCY